MVGIYKITSPSGCVYIGQSWNIERRKKDHRIFKGDTHLYNSFKKYGFENHSFEISHELPSDVEQSILDVYEQLYIDSYRDAGVKMMNIREAGSIGKHAEESKRKQSQSMKGVGKGRVQSEEWKAKRILFSNGNKVWLGKNHKEETRKKQSEAQLGKPKSDEHKNACIENFKKATQSRIRAVIQLSLSGEFIKQWPSSKDAGIGLNVWNTGITQACKGIYHSSNGFKWQYA